MTLEAPRPVSEPTPETKTPKKSNKRRNMFIAGSIGLSLAVGGGAVFAANQAPKAEPSLDVSAEPNAENITEAPVNEQQATPETSNELGPNILFDQDTATISSNIIEVMESLSNAGANDDLSDLRYEANMSYDEFLPVLAAENVKKVEQAYFISDESSEKSDTLTMLANNNRAVLEAFVSTYENTNDPVLLEGYKLFIDAQSATEISNDGTERVIEIAIDESDNTAGKMDSPLVEGLNTVFVVKVENVDGQAKLESILPKPR